MDSRHKPSCGTCKHWEPRKEFSLWGDCDELDNGPQAMLKVEADSWEVIRTAKDFHCAHWEDKEDHDHPS